jgi:hypothetical protein
VAILHKVIGGMVPHELYNKVVNNTDTGQKEPVYLHMSPDGNSDAMQSHPILAENEIYSRWNELCKQSVMATNEETAQLLSCSNDLVDWDGWIKQQINMYSPIPNKFSPTLVHDLFGSAI